MKTRRVRYERLATERVDPRGADLDRLSPLRIARLMNRADRRAVQAVGRAAPAIGRAIELIVRALSRGGRLVFVGAGTSGRLGVIEAAECPPTFDTPPALVQAVIAGGRGAVFRSVEGAEDDGSAGARQMRRRARAGDVVVGIAASGVTPFVRGALGEARQPRGGDRARDVQSGRAAQERPHRHRARRRTGGPGRLDAAQGGDGDQARAQYAHHRCLRPARQGPRQPDGGSPAALGQAPRAGAAVGRGARRRRARGRRRACSTASAGSAKLAIAMARLGLSAVEARRRLRAAAGSLRRALEGPVVDRVTSVRVKLRAKRGPREPALPSVRAAGRAEPKARRADPRIRASVSASLSVAGDRATKYGAANWPRTRCYHPGS